MESPCVDEGIDNTPSHWRGICQRGDQFNSTNYNKKLIGARWFMKGFKDQIRPTNITTKTKEFLSPRDGLGHGTHTASIAAGYFVEKANYKGLAKGGAPLAHLAIYKACWNIETGGCANADLLKAFDRAIYDGVDVLSLTIGFQIPLFSYANQRDTIVIDSFHAISKGSTVVSSEGNDDPMSQTVQILHHGSLLLQPPN